MTTIKEKAEQVDPEELQSAHKTVQAFVTAFKSFSIYPEDHIFYKTNLEKFKNQLDTFLERNEELNLSIEKNTFVYQGETIFDHPSEESNPAYLMTRDGLIQLVFLQGVESIELTKLLRILNQHRSASEVAEGDIVTSLWQAEFEHIEYEEIDIFALEAFNFDLGSLQVSPDEQDLPPLSPVAKEEEAGDQERKKIAESTGAEEEAEDVKSLAQGETVTNLLNMDQFLTVMELSAQEKATLKSYVEDEEQKDYTGDIIDVLLIILVSQKNAAHFSQVLEFLEDVFFETLKSGKFNLTHKLCSNILTIGGQIKKIRPWTRELIEHFFMNVSDAERWAGLPWMKSTQLLMLERKNMKSLLQVLRLLPPESMYSLGPLVGNIDMNNIDIRNELFEIIEHKAKQAPEKFGSMLTRSDENANTFLFPIIDKLGSMDAADISLKMMSHESPLVRRMGLDGYFTHTVNPDLEALYPLFNDENEVIVGKLLTFLLSHAEQEEVEDLLLRYLEQALFEGIEHAHMFEYYKALSMCGSSRSVRSLEKILFESSVSEMFSKVAAVHKKGSALALKVIGSEEALKVLHKGKKSMRPDIRMACQFALEKMK